MPKLNLIERDGKYYCPCCKKQLVQKQCEAEISQNQRKTNTQCSNKFWKHSDKDKKYCWNHKE